MLFCPDNYTAFVGPKTTLDDIASAITPEGDFDFARFNPVPEIYDTYGGPVNVISDEEFATKYNLKKAPSTAEDFTAFAKNFALTTETRNDEEPHKLQDMPSTAHHAIKDTYGFGDWTNWSSANWGTTGAGINADVTRCHDNLLLVVYKTPWTPPEGVFTTLHNMYENLHIINGSDLGGFADGIEVTNGGSVSFRTYFVRHSSVVVSTKTRTTDRDDTDTPETKILLRLSDQCTINQENIDALINKGVLVGEDEEIIRIDSLRTTP